MHTYIKSEISWRLESVGTVKTPETTIYKLVLRGQAHDVYEGKMSDGGTYTAEQTDLFGDMVRNVAFLELTRYNKGGAAMKDHITARLVPAVIEIKNENGSVFFATEEETDKVIEDVMNTVLDAISSEGGFMTPRRLTEAGKGALRAVARKKGNTLDIGKITTQIKDRPHNNY